MWKAGAGVGLVASAARVRLIMPERSRPSSPRDDGGSLSVVEVHAGIGGGLRASRWDSVAHAFRRAEDDDDSARVGSRQRSRSKCSPACEFASRRSSRRTCSDCRIGLVVRSAVRTTFDPLRCADSATAGSRSVSPHGTTERRTTIVVVAMKPLVASVPRHRDS